MRSEADVESQKEFKWREKDGTETPLSEMDDERLQKCLNSVNTRIAGYWKSTSKLLEVQANLDDEMEKRDIQTEHPEEVTEAKKVISP